MKTSCMIICLAVFFLVNSCPAQEVFVSSGDFFKNSMGSVSFTLGEPVIETFASGSQILTQGFQQPRLYGVGVKDPILPARATIFPNPFEDHLVIRFDRPFDGTLRYELIGLLGNRITHGALSEMETQVSLPSLVPSLYILKIIGNETIVLSYKLTKTK